MDSVGSAVACFTFLSKNFSRDTEKSHKGSKNILVFIILPRLIGPSNSADKHAAQSKQNVSFPVSLHV